MVKLSYIYKIFYFFKKRVAFVKNDVIIKLTRDRFCCLNLHNTNSKLTNFVNKLLTLITSYYDINDNIEFMVLGDGAPWVKNMGKIYSRIFP
ncbi:hypothetical protein [Spiroplasma phoeniceum]|nr:hypothetical protein [Spiroplasma phoeniceum]